MFDNQHTYLKFNSKQSSTRDIANEILRTCPRKNDSTIGQVW